MHSAWENVGYCRNVGATGSGAVMRFYVYHRQFLSVCWIVCVWLRRLNLSMNCGKKPLLMAVCFMMDNSSFI